MGSQLYERNLPIRALLVVVEPIRRLCRISAARFQVGFHSPQSQLHYCCNSRGGFIGQNIGDPSSSTSSIPKINYLKGSIVVVPAAALRCPREPLFVFFDAHKWFAETHPVGEGHDSNCAVLLHGPWRKSP